MTSHIKVPQDGAKIVPGQPVPDNPIIPFIEGDGIGIDITPVMIKVIDAAVDKAYGGKKKIHWMEVYAGEKSTRLYGPDEWLPKETFDALKAYSSAFFGKVAKEVEASMKSGSLSGNAKRFVELTVNTRPALATELAKTITLRNRKAANLGD